MAKTIAVIFKLTTEIRVRVTDGGSPSIHLRMNVYEGTDNTGTLVATVETDFEGYANIYELTPYTDYYIETIGATPATLTVKTEKDAPRIASLSQWERLVHEIQSAEVRDLSRIAENEPQANPIDLAFWTLPTGIYAYKETTGSKIVRFDNTYLKTVEFKHDTGSLLVMRAPEGSVSGIYFPSPTSGNEDQPMFVCTATDGTPIQALFQIATEMDLYGRLGKTSKTVCLGGGATSNFSMVTIVGGDAKTEGESQTAIGYGARVNPMAKGSIALGEKAKADRPGEVYVGTTDTNLGYNGTNYRLIGGVHDGIALTDAATVAQGNFLTGGAPGINTPGVLGQLYTDTTQMHTYQCTAIDTTDPNNPVYTWTLRW